MSGQRLFRGVVVTLSLWLGLAVAAPASAQVGALAGKVVDQAGKPVVDADVVFEFLADGGVTRQMTGKTDKKGEYQRAGLLVAGGMWRVSVTTKDGGIGRSEPVTVGRGGVTPMKDIVVRSAKPAAASELKLGTAGDAKTSARNADLEKRYSEARAEMDAGQYATAVTKLEQLAAEVDKCVVCYLRLADAHQQLKDLPNAEKALLAAIRLDEKNVEPYNALVGIYNEMNRLADAAKMAEAARALVTASGGRIDPVAAFNQGAILWNQGKAEEALGHFQRAVAGNPRNADAQYMLGLALLSTGKMTEAKAPLETYLKLAPTGSNAAAAKELLESLK